MFKCENGKNKIAFTKEKPKQKKSTNCITLKESTREDVVRILREPSSTRGSSQFYYQTYGFIIFNEDGYVSYVGDDFPEDVKCN